MPEALLLLLFAPVLHKAESTQERGRESEREGGERERERERKQNPVCLLRETARCRGNS